MAAHDIACGDERHDLSIIVDGNEVRVPEVVVSGRVALEAAGKLPPDDFIVYWLGKDTCWRTWAWIAGPPARACVERFLTFKPIGRSGSNRREGAKTGGAPPSPRRRCGSSPARTRLPRVAGAKGRTRPLDQPRRVGRSGGAGNREILSRRVFCVESSTKKMASSFGLTLKGRSSKRSSLKCTTSSAFPGTTTGFAAKKPAKTYSVLRT